MNYLLTECDVPISLRLNTFKLNLSLVQILVPGAASKSSLRGDGQEDRGGGGGGALRSRDWQQNNETNCFSDFVLRLFLLFSTFSYYSDVIPV